MAKHWCVAVPTLQSRGTSVQAKAKGSRRAGQTGQCRATLTLSEQRGCVLPKLPLSKTALPSVSLAMTLS